MDDYSYDPIKNLESRVAGLENEVRTLCWMIWGAGVGLWIAYYFQWGIFAP